MILVAGATGSLGSRIVRGLLARGDRVRVLRRPGRAAGTIGGTEVIIGDLRERDSLDRACRGVHSVVTTASVSKTGDDTVENVDRQGNVRQAAGRPIQVRSVAPGEPIPGVPGPVLGPGRST